MIRAVVWKMSKFRWQDVPLLEVERAQPIGPQTEANGQSSQRLRTRESYEAGKFQYKDIVLSSMCDGPNTTVLILLCALLT